MSKIVHGTYLYFKKFFVYLKFRFNYMSYTVCLVVKSANASSGVCVSLISLHSGSHIRINWRTFQKY